MKKSIAFILLIIFVLAIGCTNETNNIEPDDVLEYAPIPIEQIPDQYEDGSYSIKGFLAIKNQYVNQSVNIRGIVKYKYKCPPCPKGALCEMCASDHIILADPVQNITIENEISINFIKDNDVYQNLKLGNEIAVNVEYRSEGGGMRNKFGFIYYNHLV